MTSDSLSDLHEISKLPAPTSPPPDGLAIIPGGWTERSWEIAGQTLSLVLPAIPDAFLDDPEVIEAHERTQYMPYWAYLWPAALKMSATILQTPWPAGTEAIELGAGVGLVGLAGSRAGLRMTWTDYDSTAVELCRFNARRQGLSDFDAEVLDWQEPVRRQYPIILGCEILYEDRNHDLLIPLLQQMMPSDGIAWFGDGGRMRAERFCRLLQEAGFTYQLFDEAYQPLKELRAGQYQLIEVRRKSL